MRVPLTRQHVQDWLDFARIHVRWTIRDWTTVLFTDESRFCLDFTDRRQLVWRVSKERFDELDAVEHDRVMARAQSWFGKALTSTEN